MAIEYKRIAEVGESLMGRKVARADKRARKREKREEKSALLGAGLNFFKDIGGKVINQNNADFLLNEGFYAKNAVVDSNIKVARNYQQQWEDRLLYKGGEDAYFDAQAKAQIEVLPSAIEGKKISSPSEYAAYMYAQKNILKASIRKNSEANSNAAIAYLGKLGDNPEEALKNQMLKGRAKNVMDKITLPIVNFFTGNDSRSPTEAVSDSINDPDGLVDQGKVKKEDVQSIFDITGNYTTAIQVAEQFEEFRTSFADGVSKLGAGPNVKSEPREVSILNEFNESIKLTVIDVTTPTGVPVAVTDGVGNILDPASFMGANKKASTVPKKIIDKLAGSMGSFINKEDRELMNAFTEHKLGSAPSKEQIANFQQIEYGKIARTSQKLNNLFGNNMGFTPEMADKMASQMAVENISQMFESKTFREDIYDPSTNLLTDSNPFHPYLAIAAYESLKLNNQLPAALMFDDRFLKELQAIQPDVKNSTVGGQLAVNRLAEKLNINIPRAKPTAEQVIENNIKDAKNQKDSTLLRLKTIYSGETAPTTTLNKRSKSYQAAFSAVGSLEDNAKLIQNEASARIKVLEAKLLEKDTGMYSANRKAVKRAEIKRLQRNPNTILQD